MDESTDENRYQKIKDGVDETKNIVVDNLEKIINRGDNINNLLENSNDLNESSQRFLGVSGSLKRKIQCDNIKYYSIISLAIILFILLILFFSCGIKLDNC